MLTTPDGQATAQHSKGAPTWYFCKVEWPRASEHQRQMAGAFFKALVQRQPTLQPELSPEPQWQVDTDAPFTPGRPSDHNFCPLKAWKFNGTSDWESYVTKFQVVAQVNGWRAMEKADSLLAILEGPAEQALCDLPCGKELEFQVLCTSDSEGGPRSWNCATNCTLRREKLVRS
ncbi:hypothetical protein EOD39_5611 [Acipenser ruthenus]|uniref:Uncharacterized protein n=1 Tax=Acipenser ruthenus TaxID=7906 RepID=A0A444UDT5_ACIRT|nr:hypothetical protein EOD39_5611 [Acipenser ruthenus]